MALLVLLSGSKVAMYQWTTASGVPGTGIALIPLWSPYSTVFFGWSGTMSPSFSPVLRR